MGGNEPLLMSYPCTRICISSQKGSRGGFEPKTGEKEDAWAVVASTLTLGLVHPFEARLPFWEVAQGRVIGG